MKQADLKEFVYGGFLSILQNEQYYYHSSVGQDYSSLTEQGEEAVKEFMNMFAWQMISANNLEIEERAKALVMRGLKS
jgi:hypothetical protein